MPYKVYDYNFKVIGEFETYQNALSYYIGNNTAVLINDAEFQYSSGSTDKLKSIFNTTPFSQNDIDTSYDEGFEDAIKKAREKLKAEMDEFLDELLDDIE